jgi:hypothetical protein
MRNLKQRQAGTFSVSSFFVGFAIALWLAVVVLFILPQQDQEPCCPPMPVQQTTMAAEWGPLWIPNGDAHYYCTNNDHGGGVVEDHGGGVVDDHGGGVVDDNSAHIPAPMPGVLGRSRGSEEFWCDINPAGGPLVRHRDGRVIVVAIPVEEGEEYRCGIENSEPLVVNSDGYRINLDHGGGVVDDHGGGVVDDSWSGEPIPDSAAAGEMHYCMLADPDYGPIIVNLNGEQVNE